jgi:hypothetical protein
MATLTSVKGEVVPAKPVEYAKKLILVTPQEGPAGTVKSSATELPVILAVKPATVLAPCTSLQVKPAGAAVPLLVVAPVDNGPLVYCWATAEEPIKIKRQKASRGFRNKTSTCLSVKFGCIVTVLKIVSALLIKRMHNSSRKIKEIFDYH